MLFMLIFILHINKQKCLKSYHLEKITFIQIFKTNAIFSKIKLKSSLLDLKGNTLK